MLSLKLEEYIRKQLRIVMCLYTGSIVTGYTMAWTSPIVPKLQDPELTPLPEIISLSQASWVGSMYNIGCVFGPHLAAPLSNIVGRKFCMLAGACLNLIAQLIMLFSTSLAMIMAGRFLAGFALSSGGVIGIVYLGEIASPNIRGILITSTGVFMLVGCLIIFSLGPYVPYAVVGYVVSGMSIAYIVAMIPIPESPLFHLLKKNEELAKSTFIYLGRGDEGQKSTTVVENAKDFEKQKSTWIELLTYKSNRRSLLIAVGLYTFQMCSGTMAVGYFLMTVFERAGSSVDSAIGTIIIGVTQLIAALFVPALIERTGRKLLLLISTSGCCCCMTVMGIYFYLDKINYDALENLGWLPLVALLLSYVSVGIGLNIVPPILVGEMFRPNVRSLGATVSMTFGSFMGIISISTFGYLFEVVGYDIMFWIYGVINLLGFLFTLFIVPETKGMTS